jgi:hypothetical protein
LPSLASDASHEFQSPGVSFSAPEKNSRAKIFAACVALSHRCPIAASRVRLRLLNKKDAVCAKWALPVRHFFVVKRGDSLQRSEYSPSIRRGEVPVKQRCGPFGHRDTSVE